MLNKYNPDKHKRQSIRLKGYDYLQEGLYFITITVKDWKCLFGTIENETMILNDAGMMIEKEWLKLPERFNNIKLHEYIVMPNHFHSILEISENEICVGATLVVAQNENTNDRNENAISENDNEICVGATLVVAQNENTNDENDNEISVGTTTKIPPNDMTTAQNGNDIVKTEGQPQGIAPTMNQKNIGDMIGAFKSITTVEYIRGVKNDNWHKFNGKLWQRNYYEHIIRNEKSYLNISDYIINNPTKWNTDKFNLNNMM